MAAADRKRARVRRDPSKLGQGGGFNAHFVVGGGKASDHLPAYRHQEAKSWAASSISSFTAMKVPASEIAAEGDIVSPSE
jgi:hypothetical protein